MNRNTAESYGMPPEGGGETVCLDFANKTYMSYPTYISYPADPELELR